jgi:hypothetical protein
MDNPAPVPQPDPAVTARTQGEMNTNTAITQQLLNQTNQVGPDGSLTYNNAGETSFTGADGKSYTVPRFTATTSLSPAAQRIFDIGNQTKENLATIGRDSSSRIGSILGSNVNLSNDAIEGRLMELGTKRLAPQWAKDDESLRTRLVNSGIKEGSSAWDSEMGRLSNSKNDAINQLLLGGRQQAISEILTERQLPINEVTALMSGSQVQNPAFMNTPQAQVGGVDYAGMVTNNYNQSVAQANAERQQNGAMMGGLFGMAGTLGGAAINPMSVFRMPRAA